MSADTDSRLTTRRNESSCHNTNSFREKRFGEARSPIFVNPTSWNTTCLLCSFVLKIKKNPVYLNTSVKNVDSDGDELILVNKTPVKAQHAVTSVS